MSDPHTICPRNVSICCNIWSLLRAEFTLENFSLKFEELSYFKKKKPEKVLQLFHNSIWPCCNRLAYTIYRFVIALYYTLWFLESIWSNIEARARYTTNKNRTSVFLIHPWPFYLTSWSLAALFLHLWIAFFITFYFYSMSNKTLYPYFEKFFITKICSCSSRHSSSNYNIGIIIIYSNY
jgi:hypothetical protein